MRVKTSVRFARIRMYEKKVPRAKIQIKVHVHAYMNYAHEQEISCEK